MKKIEVYKVKSLNYFLLYMFPQGEQERSFLLTPHLSKDTFSKVAFSIQSLRL